MRIEHVAHDWFKPRARFAEILGAPPTRRVPRVQIVVVHAAFLRTVCPLESSDEYFCLSMVSEDQRMDVQRRLIVMGFTHVLAGSSRQEDVRQLASALSTKSTGNITFCLCEQLRKEILDVLVVLYPDDYQDNDLLKAATSVRSGMHLFNASFVKASKG